MNFKYFSYLIILAVSHALQGFSLIVIPFLFLDPIFYNEIEKIKRISQLEACSRGGEAIIGPSEIDSITTEFNLFCDSAWIKSFLIMVLLMGLCTTGIFFTFYSVHPNKRLYVISGGLALSGIFAITSTVGYDNSIIFLSLSLFFSYFFSYCWYSNIYTYLNEVFPKENRKFLPSIMTCFYGFGTIALVLTTYVINDWRSIFRYYYGIPASIMGITVFAFAKTFKIAQIKEEKLLEQMIALPEIPPVLGIKAILHDKTLAINALIYIFIWNMNALAFAGCDIALGNLSVDLRYAMLFLGVVQSVCSAIAGFLIIKFKPETIFKYTSVWMAIFLSIFIMEPKSKAEASELQVISFTVFMVLANFGIELNWTILVNIVQKYAIPSAQQNIFASADTTTNLLSLAIPFYIEGMQSVGLSPIFLFGILSILGRILVMFLRELPEKTDKEHELIKNPDQKTFK